ncbi:MAG: hypothetical protein LBP29_10285 [Treponema sp.]|jgi:hypothetical protein|nr:hypothetical protein [Treponema sp.]
MKLSATSAFLEWYELWRAIEDKELVCAGYAQLFYLIVREKYPGVTQETVFFSTLRLE